MSESTVDDPAPSARRLPPRRQVQLLVAGLAAVLVLFLLLPALSHLLFPPPADNAAKPDDGTFQATSKQWDTLRFERVRTGSFADMVATDGQIAVDDDRTTQVLSPYTGRVTRIFAAPGDVVRAGQPLYAVRASELVQAQSDLVSAAGALSTAHAQLAASQAAEARQHDLYLHQGAALKDWQQAQVDLASARAGLRNAQAAAAAVRGRLQVLGASGSRGAEAVVRAPIAGTVTQRLIGLGQNISSSASGSATQAFTISDFSRVWVVGNLREEDAARAHIGQRAEVRLLDARDMPIIARIDYVAPALDPASRRLTVRAVVDNPGGRLKPEMFAQFALFTGPARSSLSVPTAAVIYDGPTARVWVARAADRRLALRLITTGVIQGDRVEVRSGLKQGDLVVTQGSLFIDRGAQTD